MFRRRYAASPRRPLPAVPRLISPEEITSNGGATLLRRADERLDLTRRVAACFIDYRHPPVVHDVETLVLQRLYGLALGYEDLNDHEELRGDPATAGLERRLQPAQPAAGGRRGRISCAGMARVRVRPPGFHGYYEPPAALRAAVRCRLKPAFQAGGAILRTDSGFCREPILAAASVGRTWTTGWDAKNARLTREMAAEMALALEETGETGKAARRFGAFRYATLDSWSRERRVIGKAEALPPTVAGGQPKENHRFIVTSLPARTHPARELYEKVYCARGDAENRVKEHKLGLFSARCSSNLFGANTLRYLPVHAMILFRALREALAGTRLAVASAGHPAPPAQDRGTRPHLRTASPPRPVLRLSRPGPVPPRLGPPQPHLRPRPAAEPRDAAPVCPQCARHRSMAKPAAQRLPLPRPAYLRTRSDCSQPLPHTSNAAAAWTVCHRLSGAGAAGRVAGDGQRVAVRLVGVQLQFRQPLQGHGLSVSIPENREGEIRDEHAQRGTKSLEVQVGAAVRHLDRVGRLEVKRRIQPVDSNVSLPREISGEAPRPRKSNSSWTLVQRGGGGDGRLGETGGAEPPPHPRRNQNPAAASSLPAPGAHGLIPRAGRPAIWVFRPAFTRTQVQKWSKPDVPDSSAISSRRPCALRRVTRIGWNHSIQ